MREAVGGAMTRMRAVGAAAMVVAAAVAVASITPLAAGVFEPVSDFVEIPAGAFTMGADRARDPDAFENERWPTTAGAGIVDLPAFFIARHETTVAEFGEFVRATRWPVDTRALAAPATHPVTFVSWPDALAYCRWLESHLKKPGWRVTLPTEAEWEKAARGTDGRRFPWGNDERNGRANYLAAGSASTSTGTTPVGFFQCPDCAHGLADMSGNVWEWTGSPYQPYPYDERDDRVNLDADALWTIRGGHFGDPARMVRTTVRTGADPGARRAFIGFRVALRKR